MLLCYTNGIQLMNRDSILCYIVNSVHIILMIGSLTYLNEVNCITDGTETNISLIILNFVNMYTIC